MLCPWPCCYFSFSFSFFFQTFFYCFVALCWFFSTLTPPPHRPPHTPQCDASHPIRHVPPRANSAVMSLRLLQLSRPKLTHPDFQGNREVRSCCTQTQRAHAASRESNLSLISWYIYKCLIFHKIIHINLEIKQMKQREVCHIFHAVFLEPSIFFPTVTRQATCYSNKALWWILRKIQ